MSRKHLSGTGKRSWKVTPQPDDEAHCAEVTTVSFTIKKKFIKKIDESKYSKNRVTYVSVIPIDL